MDEVCAEQQNLRFYEKEQKKKGDNSDEEEQIWKEGDVIGCLFDQSNGTISYSRNVSDLGIAYTLEKSTTLSTSS